MRSRLRALAYRLGLTILLLTAMLWLWAPRWDELAYHTWQKHELVNIGDAINFSQLKNPPPFNSYVEVSGIVGDRAATLKGLRLGTFRYGTHQIRHLLGSKIYIEYDQEKYHSKFSPFNRVTVSGRLIPFAPGGDLERVREFFLKHYRKDIDENSVVIVVDEKPKSEMIYVILFFISLVVLLLSLYFSIREILNLKAAKI